MDGIVTRAFEFSLFFAELLVATCMFVKKADLKKLWYLRLIGCVALIIGVSFLAAWLKEIILPQTGDDGFNLALFGTTYLLTVFFNIAFFVLYELVLGFFLQINIVKIVFVGCAAFAVQNIANCLYSLFVMVRTIGLTVPMRHLSDPVNLTARIICYIAIYLSCYFIFRKKRNYSEENFLHKKILFIFLGIVLIIILLGREDMPKNDSEAEMLYLFMLVGRILLSVMGLAMQFFVLEWHRSELQRLQQERIMHQQREQYEIAKESIDTVNVNAHDLKHQISVIMDVIRDNGYGNKIENELNKMVESIDIVDTVYNTGNRALDVTLTEKSRICRQKDINLSTIADGTGINFMSDLDIYTMFGNALDNAVEAVEQISETDKRIISLSVRRDRELVTIHIENTYKNQPKFINGLPQTNKTDKNFHGFGVKSIMQIVAKYSGNATMTAKNGLFYLDIILCSDSSSQDLKK